MSQLPSAPGSRFNPLIALVGLIALAALVMSVVSVVDDSPGQTVLQSPDQVSGVPAEATPTPEPAAEAADAGADVVTQPVVEEPAGPPPAGSGGTVEVSLTDFAITDTRDGDDVIEVDESAVLAAINDSSSQHNVKVEGQESAYGTPDLLGGEEADLDLYDLSPGIHVLYCDIAGHRDSGMEATLVVEAATGDAPTEVVQGESAEAEPPPGDGGAGDEVDPESLTGMARAEWLRDNYEASVAAFPAETSAMGNQKMEPEILDDGTKVFELTIDETEWEVAPGEIVEAVAYNGQVPGPWIDVEVGDNVLIRIINELDDEATTLHPHGIFMHPFEVDGVGMVSMDPIMPGEVFEMEFTPQETSVGMYHGHDNGVHQVINGAFGAFTVGDLPLPAQADNVVKEDVMILNDAGEIGLTLNAKSFPATAPLTLVEGEQMILHYYNEGLTPHPMHLHNNAQMVIAKDGYPLAVPIVMDTVNVAPGERYSVVIFAESPGTWVYHCHILTHVEKLDGSVFGMFTALVVEPSDDPNVNDDLSRDLGRDQIPSFPGQGAPADAQSTSGGTAPPEVTATTTDRTAGSRNRT